MHFANFLTLDDDGNYNVSWMFNSSMDTLHFMVEVRTTGWIGFGIATVAPNAMQNYDVAVGGVSGGIGYLKVKLLWADLLLIEMKVTEAIFYIHCVHFN